MISYFSNIIMVFAFTAFFWWCSSEDRPPFRVSTLPCLWLSYFRNCTQVTKMTTPPVVLEVNIHVSLLSKTSSGKQCWYCVLFMSFGILVLYYTVIIIKNDTCIYSHIHVWQIHGIFNYFSFADKTPTKKRPSSWYEAPSDITLPVFTPRVHSTFDMKPIELPAELQADGKRKF